MFLETRCRFEVNLGYGQRQGICLPCEQRSLPTSDLFRKIEGTSARRVGICCISGLNSQSFKCFFSSSWLLQQKTMITIENNIVTGDVLL